MFLALQVLSKTHRGKSDSSLKEASKKSLAKAEKLLQEKKEELKEKKQILKQLKGQNKVEQAAFGHGILTRAGELSEDNRFDLVAKREFMARVTMRAQQVLWASDALQIQEKQYQNQKFEEIK